MAGHPIPDEAFPDVNPTGAPSGDFEHVEASPNQFGGAIAQGEEKLGQAGVEAGNTGINILTMRQGMLNETLSTNAETSYMTDLGKLTAAYKSKEGLAAVNAQPQYESDVAQLRQRYLQTLPNFGAQRAFNLLALRHEGFAIQDSAGYSASQLKSADLNSANASSGAAIDNAGIFDVASNDQRFQDQIHSIDFATRRQMQNQGWGDYMKEDADHNLTFDDSPQGQQAKSIYEATNGKALSMAYENRYNVLADRNAVTAYDQYQKERDKIPGEAQVRLDAMFTPKIRDAQVSTISSGVLTKADQQYTVGQDAYAAQKDKSVLPVRQGGSAPVNQTIPPEGRALLQTLGGPESGNRYDALYGSSKFNNFADHPRIEFPITSGPDVGKQTSAAGYYQFEKATWDMEAKKLGLKDFSPASQDAAAWDLAQTTYKQKTGNDLLKDLQSGKSVASVLPALSSQWASLPGGRQPAGIYSGSGGGGVAAQPMPSKADYYRSNYASIVDDARTQAQNLHPDDSRFADVAAARVEQQMSTVIKQQELAYKADSDLVQQAYNGQMQSQNGKRPASIDEMIGGNPDVKSAWERMQINNPLAAEQIETRILTANAKSGGHDLATYGSGFYNLFRRIHAPEGDPERITDPTQLYGHVGENGDLTVSGLDKLTTEIGAKRTPEGEAEGEMKKQFLVNSRAQITGSDEGLHIKDPKGDELYLKYLAQVLPSYDDGRKQGKSAAQLLNPDSPDYVGKIIPNFKRPMDQWFNDTIHDAPATAQAPAAAFDVKTVKSVDDLVSAYRAGKVSKVVADQTAIANGWAVRKAAMPQVPMSQ